MRSMPSNLLRTAWRCASAACCLVLLPFHPAQADGAFLVADLNGQETQGDAIGQLSRDFQPVELDGILYFVARHPQLGRELWRSDGTPGGTRVVTDLCPGPCSSFPSGLSLFGDRIYFAASDGVWGNEPWSTDGTPGGTYRLADVCPGPCHSIGFNFSGFGELGGRVYFNADDGENGPELWRVSRDGEAELFLETFEGSDGATVRPLVTGGDLLFFEILSFPHPNPGIWRTDGTAAGTFALGFEARQLRFFDDRLYATVKTAGEGLELWVSDGTPGGSQLFADLCPGTCWGSPSFVTIWQDRLYFTARPSVGSRPFYYRTDGTVAGTERLFDTPPVLTSSFGSAAVLGDRLFFTASQSATGEEVWSTDGTTATLLADLEPGPDSLYPLDLTVAGGRLFFRAVAGLDIDVWVSDGSEEGTARIADSNFDHELAEAGGRLFFPSDASGTGLELWTSDGSAGGTHLVRDIFHGPGSSRPALLTPFDDLLYFAPRDAEGERGLWRTDGSAPGTSPLGIGPARPWEVSPHDGRLLFSSSDFPSSAPGDVGLWETDGTPEGTRVLVSHLYRAGSFSELPGGDLLFASETELDPLYYGRELWRTDGTEDGTSLVRDVAPGGPPITPPMPFSSRPRDLVELGGRTVFVADVPVRPELWSSDGTEDGTFALRELCPSPDFHCPVRPVRLGDTAFFVATDDEAGRELWRTDGTVEGTARFADLRPGPESSAPHHLLVLDGLLYFAARILDSGEQLMVTDGTPEGTRMVDELRPEGSPAWVLDLVAAGRRLFFTAASEATGAELWVSKGLPGTTRIVRELQAGPDSSFPGALTALDSRVVFAADDGASGLEPWISDGTAGGTRQIDDIAPGVTSSTPEEFVAAGTLLFFRADAGDTGRELWAIELDTLLDDPCGPGTLCAVKPRTKGLVHKRE